MDDSFQWTPESFNAALTRGAHMETGTKINQQPELSLSAEIEPYAKGGWKTTIRASVRVFDGNDTDMYARLEDMLQSGLAIANNAILSDQELRKQAGLIKEGTTNDQ